MKSQLIICLIAFSLIVVGTSSSEEQSEINLADQISSIRAAANTLPPKFNSPEHRQKIEVLWNTTETSLQNYAKGRDKGDCKLETLLGDLYRMGHNLGIEGSSEKAKTHLIKASELDPTNPTPNHLLGNLLTVTGDLDDGELYLLRAYALSAPQLDPNVLFDLVSNSYLKREYKRTVFYCNQYLKNFPDNQEIRFFKRNAKKSLEYGWVMEKAKTESEAESD